MDVDGLIVVDKPGGMTSHDVVARVRRLAKTRRVGHGGTLDPMATGVLIIGVNKATRLLTYVIGSGKRYTATIRLGESTITDDAEGDVTSRASAAAVTEDAIRTVLARQVGEIDQVPSAVSAIKINGERAYKRVREGETVEIPARRVTIHSLEVQAIRRSTIQPPAISTGSLRAATGTTSAPAATPAATGSAGAPASIPAVGTTGAPADKPAATDLAGAPAAPDMAGAPAASPAATDMAGAPAATPAATGMGGAPAASPAATDMAGAPAATPAAAGAIGAPASTPGEAETVGPDAMVVVDVDIDVSCSSGTYIRAIARDLGAALGVGGHLTALRRTTVGGFTLAEAATLPQLEERAPDVIGLSMADAGARAFARRDATEEEARILSHGGPLATVGLDGPYAVFGPDGTLLAIVSERDGRAKAEIVLAAA